MNIFNKNKLILLIKAKTQHFCSLSLVLIFWFIASTSGLQAQTVNKISGNVSDDNGLPLIGVNVLVKETSTGTITDIAGNFNINASPTQALVFSYVGYKNAEVLIGSQTVIQVSLAEDSEVFEEIVVVGYGTQKKSHLTGAIAKISGADVAAIQATRVDDAIAGKLAGVLIQNQDGSPGADPKIKIRASSSISGSSNPLIVVDGFPISGNLATVNPNDIESMEVLKDAASSAIYGSRGANGVILITTKKGKSGKPTFSYNSYVSTSSRYVKDIPQLKTAGEWATELQAGIADGTYNVSELDPRLVDYRINAYKNAPGVVSVQDWLFQNGSAMNHDFNMAGGSDDVNYFASVGYLNSKGVVQTQGFEKYNARLNLNAKLGDKFKTGVSFNGFLSNRDILGHDMRDLLRSYSISPIYHTAESIAFVQELDAQRQALADAGVTALKSTFDSGYRGGTAPFNSSIYTLKPGMTAQDWHYGRSGNGIGGTGDSGPATKLDNTNRYQKTFFANVSTYLQYSIFKDLNIKTILGGDINTTEDFFSRTLEFDSQARTNQTALNTNNLNRSSVLSETTLNYGKTFGKHDVSAVAGLEFQTFFTKGITLNGQNVPFGQPLNYALLNPADISVSERDETIARRSVFGRINYAYNDRYLASLSVRRDGDSRFGVNKRFATFPAISLGWNVHNESFYHSDLLTGLKLRFSSGSLGTTSFLGAYNSLSLLNPKATVFGNGFLIPSNIANPNLTWQTNTETNFGTNLGFLNGRFTLGVDYYTSNINDILINQSVSEVLGTTSIALNSGDVKSSGLEFDLGATLVNQGNFRWNIGANLATVKSEITDLGGLSELPQVIYGASGRGPVFRNYIGGAIGEMWGLQTDGQVESKYMKDPTVAIGINSSEYYVVDQNGDGKIDATRTVENGGDLVKIGQNTPDFYWGLNSQMSFKDFDFSLQVQGSQGGEIFNVDPIYYSSEFGGRLTGSFDANKDGIADHNGKFFKPSNSQLDAQIQDASFISLRNVTLGYTLNSRMAKKVGLSGVRIYAAATNLLYLMGGNYTSLNPEGIDVSQTGYLGPTTYGVQNGASPVVKSFTFGLNVNF